MPTLLCTIAHPLANYLTYLMTLKGLYDENLACQSPRIAELVTLEHTILCYYNSVQQVAPPTVHIIMLMSVYLSTENLIHVHIYQDNR